VLLNKELDRNLSHSPLKLYYKCLCLTGKIQVKIITTAYGKEDEFHDLSKEESQALLNMLVDLVVSNGMVMQVKVISINS